MGDRLPLQGALVVVVEVFEGLPRGEPCCADAAFVAVGLAGGDLALQAGGQELLVGPALGSGAFGEALDRAGQRRGLQRPGQEHDLRGDVAPGAGGGGLGGHQVLTCPSSPKMRS
jgi:hypothetical protein